MESNLNRITAILGPTNTGKTHLAVETLLEYESGILIQNVQLQKVDPPDQVIDAFDEVQAEKEQAAKGNVLERLKTQAREENRSESWLAQLEIVFWIF